MICSGDLTLVGSGGLFTTCSMLGSSSPTPTAQDGGSLLVPSFTELLVLLLVADAVYHLYTILVKDVNLYKNIFVLRVCVRYCSLMLNKRWKTKIHII